ncbi:MAG: hypothetical protein NDJ89_12545 [Oligoflexia bacterium]|nr:hypothetical protein [Oligoflexia bacterium]
MKTLIALLFLLPVTALASGADLSRFFESLEGRWNGRGTSHPLERESPPIPFRFDLRFAYQGRGAWSFEERASSELGERRFGGIYQVRGDSLTLLSGGRAVPLAVVESTPERLKYRLQAFEGPTGRLVEYTFSLTLDEEGRLHGFNSALSGGKRIAEESFVAERGRGR